MDSDSKQWENHRGEPTTPPPVRKTKRHRLTAALGEGRSILLTGCDPSLDGFIEVLEDALGKARKARQLKLSLKTFLSMLQDQAENADSA